MLQYLIQKYKQVWKRRYLHQHFHAHYAFIGLGSHSIDNLYPVLRDLGINLKYIALRTPASAKLINQKWPETEGITDLNRIWEDEEVQGVFIAATPSAHFELTKAALQAGKHVFVEKPPCFSVNELQELAKLAETSGRYCMVGLQKRYAPAVKKLKARMGKGLQHYSLKYLTGSYPEGDPLWDLFIHPLDLVNFLFGPAELLARQRIGKNGRQTLLLQLGHANGLKGSLELSTAYSWELAGEDLTLQSNSGTFVLQDSQNLYHFPVDKQFIGIPINKILSVPLRKSILAQQNSFIPLRQNNPIVMGGFYAELVNFVKLVETQSGKNLTSLTELKNTYLLIEEIQNYK